jgi:hypothetical protein
MILVHSSALILYVCFEMGEIISVSDVFNNKMLDKELELLRIKF